MSSVLIHGDPPSVPYAIVPSSPLSLLFPSPLTPGLLFRFPPSTLSVYPSFVCFSSVSVVQCIPMHSILCHKSIVILLAHASGLSFKLILKLQRGRELETPILPIICQCSNTMSRCHICHGDRDTCRHLQISDGCHACGQK